MDNKQINIVWCDDNIDSFDNEHYHEQLARHNCVMLEKAKSSEELKKILTEKKDYIDAVIVDFNVGSSEIYPDKRTVSGFRWVHEHLEEYSPLPFYLYSGREWDFIKGKYEDFEFSMENDYFFTENSNVTSKRNRYFQSDEFEDLLQMIEEEVGTLNTPEFRIRQEYHDAFNAIEKCNLDGDVFMRILLSDENIDRYELCNKANPLRMVIESMVSKLVSCGIIPISYEDNLNAVPNLLIGKEKDSNLYSPEDFMPRSLSEAFRFFLNYTQDGSHDKNYLSIEFHNYLKSSKDIYIVKALAIICLDIIKWMNSFYQKYIELKPCAFTPFRGIVKELKTVNGKEGGIIYHAGKKYFVPQQLSEALKYKVGTNVEIRKISPTVKDYGDYYCVGWNLDVK